MVSKCKFSTYLINILDKTTFPYINIFSVAKTAIEMMNQVIDIVRLCANWDTSLQLIHLQIVPFLIHQEVKLCDK